MRLAGLIALTMVAFAANSVLNRLAVGFGAIDSASFAVIRVASGAVVLGLLAGRRMKVFPIAGAIRAMRGAPPLAHPAVLEKRRSKGLWGAVSLSIYMVGFSLAYQSLDAGIGALLLFGTVQVALFAFQAVQGGVAVRAMLGAGIAFGGLALALWPAPGAAVSLGGAGLMTAAGLGWAAYTWLGRGAQDPLAETGVNFVYALPLTATVLILGPLYLSGPGVLLAMIAGGVTSALGYALWYAVLPRLTGQTAAVVQLSVPVIAIAGGALLLGEPVGARVLGAAVLVLGGIALAVTSGSAPKGRR